MTIPMPILLSFGLLAMAIATVWLRPVRLGARRAVPLWIPFFGAALISAVLFGFINWQGLAVIGVYCLSAYGAQRWRSNQWLFFPLLLLSALIALALSMHRLPGFFNPTLIADIRFSAASQAFTQRANFDTGSAGLILLVMFCHPVRRLADWKELLRRAYPLILLTLALVLGLGVVIGFIKPDVKFPAYTMAFMLSNLLFTCVAEEAFFRGLIQQELGNMLGKWRFGGHLALVVAAGLFGLAHGKGGPQLMLLASLAGLGYGYAYLTTKRIEAAILCHFALNAVHFIGFSYPRLG